MQILKKGMCVVAHLRQDGGRGYFVLPPPYRARDTGYRGQFGDFSGHQAGRFRCAGEGRQSGEVIPPAGAGAGHQAAHAHGTAQGDGVQVGAGAGDVRIFGCDGRVGRRPADCTGAWIYRCFTTTERLKYFKKCLISTRLTLSFGL